MRNAGMICSPVLRSQDAIDDPQVVHNGLIKIAEHETAGTCRVCLPSGRVNGERYDVDLRASDLGRHTEEVLAELDYSASDISRLKASGVAHQFGG
jgi:crotonobetainyl-CoA:carnitine CoA-transferase CaiB-like acyl-CoA transferase